MRLAGATPRRVPAVVAVLAALVAGGLADRVARPVPGERAEEVLSAMPVATPAGALSSTWYCAGATAVPPPAGFADGSVIVANPGDRPVRGTVTFVSNDDSRAPVPVPLDVGARDVEVLRHQDSFTAPYAAALVEVEGGGVVVEHSVVGPLGSDVAPCASSASDRWYFGDGGTSRGAGYVMALFNPFPEDAIVDLVFATEEGRVVPQALQGLVVKGGRLLAVNVGEHVLRRLGVSATVVARTGRLVADRIQTYDGTGGRKGLALVLGAPSPGRLWYFPEGYTVPGRVERIQVYNPSEREARLLVEVALEQGAAEPFELTVPAEQRFTLRLDTETRIPKGVGHAVTVRSTNGVGVVVERSFDFARPDSRAGLASTLGARQAARRWAFAAGLVTRDVDEWLVLMNPGEEDAVIDVAAFGGGETVTPARLQDLPLPAGRRMAVRLSDHVQRAPLPLVVTADHPVVAERALYRVNGVGASLAVGIPLRD